jgi:AcrR family transcriptional regulator
MTGSAADAERDRPRVRAERSDSIRNRAAVIAAAQSVLAREGLDAPLERIAAEAGVGIGTVYRHFPTRPDLWQEVLCEPLHAMLTLVERALADPDPWNGFADYIRESCALEADKNGGYVNIMTTGFRGAPELLELRAAIQDRVVRLFERAHAAGVIRDDLTVEDLIFITLSNSRIIEVTREVAPTAWKRNVELFLDGVRAERAHPMSEPPMTPAQILKAIMAMRPPRRSTPRTAAND